jgi:hypothetical protein
MTRVLVPLAVLEGETVSSGLVESLSNAEVVLLGYHVVPEQTPPGQARMSFEERAEDALGEAAEVFENAGVPVEKVLVFTHDRGETVARVADEHGCSAVVSNQPAHEADEVFVPLLPTGAGDETDTLADVVASLLEGREVGVEVIVFAEEADDARAETFADALLDRGLPTSSIAYGSRATDTPVIAASEEATGYDLVVMRNEFSLADLVLGDKPRRVAESSLTPVVGVLKRR